MGKPPNTDDVRKLLGMLGPVGKHSHSKINAEDQGPMALAISAENGAVVIHFGQVVEWIGFQPDQAFAFAEGVRAMAERIIKQRPEPSSD